MILYDLGENSLAVIPRASFQENHNKPVPKDKETNGNGQLKAGPAYSLRLDAIHRVVGVSLVSRKVTREKDRLTAPLAWRARIRRRTG